MMDLYACSTRAVGTTRKTDTSMTSDLLDLFLLAVIGLGLWAAVRLLVYAVRLSDDWRAELAWRRGLASARRSLRRR